MNIRYCFYVLITLLLISPASNSYGKYYGRLELEIYPTEEAKQAADAEIKKLQVEIANEMQKKKLRYDEKTIRKMAQTKYLNSLTLSQYMDMITPESRKWLEQFYNNVRPKDIPEFSVYYEKNSYLTFEQLKIFNQKIDKIKDITAKANFHELLSEGQIQFQPPPSVPLPYIEDIVDSLMIDQYNFDGQIRYLISTPGQNLFLRGSYTPSNSPYYPYYGNVFCEDCCGPAAGQSILEWFNVPVRKPDGTLLTSTNDIQKRLANLMDTEDGIDYTHPDDLAKALTRNEFSWNKGYCYKDGGGIFEQLHYMLSNGTPVILLIAEDKWAHYITIYGYNLANDEYYLANSENYTKEELKDLWNFSNTSMWADAAYALVNVNSNSLFSYSNDGCNTDWEYNLAHSDILDYNSLTRHFLYYDKFNDDHVDFHNENNMDLNFYGYYTYTLVFNPSDYYHPDATPTTKVNSDFQKINLNSPNTSVISHIVPQQTVLRNNSINKNISLEVWLDKLFLNRFDKIYCGFVVKNTNEDMVIIDYEKCLNRIDVSASNSNPANYVFKFSKPYQTDYKKVEFYVHGGFRKQEWFLDGCINDNDNDNICDEYDKDDDNDGFDDDADNCPKIPNPSQEDNDGNGIGKECDYREKCLLNCDPEYYSHPSQSLCNLQCGDRVEFDRTLDDSWIKIINSKWWDFIHKEIDIEDPKFMETKTFNELYKEYDDILELQGVMVNEQQGKLMLWNMIKEHYTYPTRPLPK